MKVDRWMMSSGQVRVMLGVAMACVLLCPGYCLAAPTTLMVQQTPVDGGTVTPDPGIHTFGVNSSVTLTATPRPGYQFVYWLGDVSDPTGQSTIATLDGPKIIVAVFERIQYETLAMDSSPRSAAYGGLYPTMTGGIGGGGGGAPGAKRPSKWHWPSPIDNDEEPDEDEFPVPDETNDIVVPGPVVPEPATIALLGMGAILALRYRRHTRPI
jgi:hypothetical protein